MIFTAILFVFVFVSFADRVSPTFLPFLIPLFILPFFSLFFLRGFVFGFELYYVPAFVPRQLLCVPPRVSPFVRWSPRLRSLSRFLCTASSFHVHFFCSVSFPYLFSCFLFFHSSSVSSFSHIFSFSIFFSL